MSCICLLLEWISAVTVVVWLGNVSTFSVTTRSIKNKLSCVNSLNVSETTNVEYFAYLKL